MILLFTKHIDETDIINKSNLDTLLKSLEFIIRYKQNQIKVNFFKEQKLFI